MILMEYEKSNDIKVVFAHISKREDRTRGFSILCSTNWAIRANNILVLHSLLLRKARIKPSIKVRVKKKYAQYQHLADNYEYFLEIVISSCFFD